MTNVQFHPGTLRSNKTPRFSLPTPHFLGRIMMAFSKAVRQIFIREQEVEKSPHVPPQANERRPRARSSSMVRWWRNESRSRERLHISGPFDSFPILAPRAQVFDSQITPSSLSQILIWYVYYDVVQVPAKGSKWSNDLPWESMVGWIGLGMELKRTNSFPSKTLKLTCDELEIDAGQVAARLVRLSDRTSMLSSQLDPKTLYEKQAQKLMSDLELVKSLRPIPRTTTEILKREIELRIRDYMEVVYLPVLNVGQFEPQPATTVEESNHRNHVRERLDQVRFASRDAPPKNIYNQAHEMLGRHRVSFPGGQKTSSNKLLRASGDSDSNTPQNSSSNGSERNRSRSIGTQLDQSHTQRYSAPDLNDLELVLNRMRAHHTQFAEDLRHLRLQQDQTLAIRRTDSLDPFSGAFNSHHKAALNANSDISNHGNYMSSEGHETSLSYRPGVLPSRFSNKRLPRSTELAIRRSSHDTTESTRNTATIRYETHPSQSERVSSEWPRSQHENGAQPYLPRQSHTCHSDERFSQPMVRQQRPSYLLNGVESELASETRQQQDANEEFDNNKYRVHGQAWRALDRDPSRSSNASLADRSSIITNPWDTLDSIAALPLTGDRNCLAADSPSLSHEPSIFMTPPPSPTTSMLNMPWRRIPGAWPPGSEAGPLCAMSPCASIYDPVRGPSRATMAGFSDITDPGELTAAEAIRYQTRRAMASMVDLNALPSRSSQSSERCCSAEANGDVERD